MSATPSPETHDEGHTGPVKTPKQLLAAVLFSFVVPVFVIIGLVNYVTSLNKPIAGAEQSERVTLERIQKVGTVEILDANRVMKTGEEVFKAQCGTCHAAGLAGAPKFGDAAAWAPRIKTGYETLLNSSLKGKNAMGAQGGGNFDDYEIARAVVYLANGSGAKFAEPAQPAAPVAPAQ
jgi:cytochrome c5